MVCQAVTNLLNLNLCTSLFEGFLQCISLVLGDAFLNGLGSTVNELFGLFKTKGCEILDSLHNGELLGHVRNTLQDDVERGLLLGSGGTTSGGTSGDCDSGSGGLDTVFLLQEVSEFFYFFNG